MFGDELQNRGVRLFWLSLEAKSVDDLMTSQSIGGHRSPNFQMLDAKIASALKKIIQNFYLKKRVNLAEQEAFLRGRQIAFMIYEYFQVTGAHEVVLDNSDLFRIVLHIDDVQDLIRDGTRSYYQSIRFPMMVFWNVCTRCEYG